jgi:UDP-N-acetylmuramate: L-alanyl-gamma-D-glutamyl-meso-diaminopimelate ligase
MLPLSTIKSVHLIGVAGTGMGAFAGLLKQAGYQVSGSDSVTYPPMSTKLKEWGIEVKTPYDPKNLDHKPDLVIIGNVLSKDNVEAAAVRERGLAFMSFPAALSHLFLQDRKSAVVAGTHGKTTTSALLAHTLTHAGRDPSFLVGGIPQNFGEGFHYSEAKERFFVIEGDEYDTAYFDKGPKFLHYRPYYLLCTSLEYDHADIYANVEQIIKRFTQLISLVPKEGQIVAYSNAPSLQIAIQNSERKAPLTTYGPQGEYRAQNQTEGALGISFDVYQNSVHLGKLSLPLSGQHNIDNALGAYVLLKSMGLSHDEIAAGYSTFKGVKRRLEEVGTEDGVLVIDDFAHHPTAVELTTMGAKKKYGTRPLWALFEPRSASSCRNIFQEPYAKSFHAVDRVLLAPLGRELDKSVSLDLSKLAHDIEADGTKAQACHSHDEIIDIVVKEAPKNAVLLCMSNGSFGNIHTRLLESLKRRSS